MLLRGYWFFFLFSLGLIDAISVWADLCSLSSRSACKASEWAVHTDSLNVHGWPEDMSEEEEDCRGACSCPLEIGLSEMNRLCWSVARWTSQYTFSGVSHDSWHSKCSACSLFCWSLRIFSFETEALNLCLWSGMPEISDAQRLELFTVTQRLQDPSCEWQNMTSAVHFVLISPHGWRVGFTIF